jgi:hypothetical protein
MNQWFGGFVVCVLGLFACNVEHYEDCGGDGFDEGTHAGGESSPGPGAPSGPGLPSGPGSPSEAGAGATPDASGSGTSGSGGSSGSVAPIVTPCAEERDCAAGFNCDHETELCQAADEETCGELATERACTHRSDCTAIYAGTNCSCGQDCECRGGDPGCVCESFEFFACAPAPQ